MIESDSMREILRLKQELMDGNYDQAVTLVSKLQTMFVDDRLNLLANFLSLAISRLIVIQVVPDYLYISHVYELRNSLIEIKNKNRMSIEEESFYVDLDNWQQLYEDAVPWALLLAVETTEVLDDISPQDLEQLIDFQLLKKDTLKLVRATYTFNPLEIDSYLRSLWSERQIHRY